MGLLVFPTANIVTILSPSASYRQITGKLNLCQTRHTPQISPFRFTLLASIPFQTGSIAG